MAVSDFDLPQLSEFPELVLTSLMENGLVRREMEGYNHGRLQEIVDETDQLNDGQRVIYDQIVESIDGPELGKKLFF
ncbi:hypothetical protein BBJ28_00025469, partial [Nothophytophthora sp. Chile5]